MDERFQDKIDDYLLGRMDEAEKEGFLHEVEQDPEKKEQLEFTRTVKDSIVSREEKLRALAQFRYEYESMRHPAAMGCDTCSFSLSQRTASSKATEEAAQPKKKRTWWWVTGVAAVLAAGFFALRPTFQSSSPKDGAPMERLRGGDDVFCPALADSTDSDKIKIKETEKDTTTNE